MELNIGAGHFGRSGFREDAHLTRSHGQRAGAISDVLNTLIQFCSEFQIHILALHRIGYSAEYNIS
jgi:hypothetical protein